MLVQLVTFRPFSVASETLAMTILRQRRCLWAASESRKRWMKRSLFDAEDSMAGTHEDNGFEVASGSVPLPAVYRSIRHMVVRTW